MIPNMYKIAGELTPAVLPCRGALAGDARAVDLRRPLRRDGRARRPASRMLASNSVQEAQDLALIAHAATLEARVPFLHFFDGFRTSHEINKIEQLDDDDLRAMIDERAGRAPTARAGSLARSSRASAARRRTPTSTSRRARRCNPFYLACPASCRRRWTSFAALTGRALSPVRLRRRAGRRARHRGHGLGRRDRAGDRRCAGRARREGRRAEGAPVPPVLGRAFLDALPADRARRSRCWIAPRSRARRRAALPGCGRRAARGCMRRRIALRQHAAGDRRALWTVVEGIHAGDGQGRSSTSSSTARRSVTSRSASTTT